MVNEIKLSFPVNLPKIEIGEGRCLEIEDGDLSFGSHTILYDPTADEVEELGRMLVQLAEAMRTVDNEEEKGA